MRMVGRKSGILLHISSLPCEFGIGDLGSCAYAFVDFLNETKQHYWQVLPVNPTDSLSQHSPYSSHSAFAGNVLFISPQLLSKDGFLTDQDVGEILSSSSRHIDYVTVVSYKSGLYDKAYNHFKNDPGAYKKSFNQFREENAFWLNDYALFVAIKKKFNEEIWTSWPEDFKKRGSDVLQKFTVEHEDEITKITFLQYLFFRQWEQLKAYCQSKNVSLIGDVAIYMHLDSVDVWTNPRNYQLDDNYCPTVVSGVPPDAFSDVGQRWGNPVYDWEELRREKFSWWIQRLELNFHLFDVVRIDHFRGMVQYWEIPENEQTAINGKWRDVPTVDFFRELEKYFARPLPIIAEDLGHITEDVHEVMRQFGFPGMKVLLFAFENNLIDHPYLPHNYDSYSVVYTGTHDNNTVLGWFENKASEHELNNMQTYLKKVVLSESVCWDLIRLAFSSPARLAIISMQDILGLGAEARMNTPATISGNWMWRLGKEMLSPKVIRELKAVTVDAHRA